MYSTMTKTKENAYIKQNYDDGGIHSKLVCSTDQIAPRIALHKTR